MTTMDERRDHGKPTTDDLYAARDFESFWSVYDALHADPRTRKLHAVATTSAMALIGVGLATRRATPLLLAPLVDHAIAQGSHRIIEKNRTTPWRRPVWHVRAELRLWRETMFGERLRGADRGRDSARRSPSGSGGTPPS